MLKASLLTLLMISSFSCELIMPEIPGYSITTNNPYNTVSLVLYIDPHCPDSANFWPILESVLQRQIDESRELIEVVSLHLHAFPLPFHRNSFYAAWMMNFFKSKSAVEYINFMGKMFENADYFNEHCDDKSVHDIQTEIVRLARDCLIQEDKKVDNVFRNTGLKNSARWDVKMGLKMGVVEYPTLFMNSFPLDLEGITADKLFSKISSVVKRSDNKMERSRVLSSSETSLLA